MERLINCGKIVPKSSNEISESRMGLGMEKLDRDAFDPEKVYDKVAATGTKWIRLQSGWQKTEKEKGVYDFAWLDSQVDNLLKRGLKPWICLCYGNVVYDELAKEYVGAVGCTPIRTEEAYNAWLDYVRATAEHFSGRVEYYEVWNEPEGGWTWRPEANTKEYADFCIATSAAVKSADSNAKIITGSHYEDSMRSFGEEFSYGMLDASDAISFHSYQYDERKSMIKAKAFKRLAEKYGKTVEVIQGESGSQSSSGGNGALWWVRTDKDMQAKQILRHIVADLLCDVKFTSIFSCVDMAENLDAKEGEPITTCGYFGLLGADFDAKNGKLIGNYYEKPSYYAYQNLCSVFGGNFKVDDMPVIFTPDRSMRIDGWDTATEKLIYGGFARENGSHAFAYWCATDMITIKDYESTVTFELFCGKGDIRIIDPKNGSVYKIPEEIISTKDGMLYRFTNLPIKDYPLIITVGDFTDFE